MQLSALPPSPDRLRTELEVQLAKGVAVRAGLGYSVPSPSMHSLGVRALRGVGGSGPLDPLAPWPIWLLLRGRAVVRRGPSGRSDLCRFGRAHG